MKKSFSLVLATSLLAAAVPSFSASVGAAEKNAPRGSIRLAGSHKSSELAALVKISFEQALKIALGAVPGSVVKAELEIEDGNLQYSFEIVGSNRKTIEVEIDAGDGRVLDIDVNGKD